MSDIELVWPNKELILIASGESDYEWMQPDDPVSAYAPEFITLSSSAPDARGSALAIGDGLDVLQSLSMRTTLFDGGIRLVYIDPPFNTQADIRQYRDSMKRSVWLSMMRDRLIALRSLLAEDASIGCTLTTRKFIVPGQLWTKFSAKARSLRQ